MNGPVQRSPDIPAATQRRIASAVLEAGVAKVAEWSLTSIHRPFNVATGGVFRAAGRACVSSGVLPWSAILKVIRAPREDVAEAVGTGHQWDREARIYASGLLDQLEGVCAPRWLRVDRVDDATIHLWLEDVAHPPAGARLREHAHWIARRLGEFNGIRRDEMPAPGIQHLGRTDLRALVASYARPLADFDSAATGSHACGLWPDTLRVRMLRLWRERDVYLDVLDRLPATLCHGDAFSRNLLIDTEREQITAVDWSFAGLAPLGSELAPMVAASIFFGDLDPVDQHSVAEEAWLGYLDGLRSQGWNGQPGAVRFAYAATAALRYALYPLPVFILRSEIRERFEQTVGQSAEAILRRWEVTAAFLLDLAGEAGALLPLARACPRMRPVVHAPLNGAESDATPRGCGG